MKIIRTLPFMLLFALGACGKSKGDELAGEANAIKAEMCKCKDAECADKVKDKWEKFEEKLEKTWKSEKDAPKDVVAKVMKAEDEMRSCRDDANAGGGGDK